jgi:hypothetical protein
MVSPSMEKCRPSVVAKVPPPVGVEVPEDLVVDAEVVLADAVEVELLVSEPVACDG